MSLRSKLLNAVLLSAFVVGSSTAPAQSEKIQTIAGTGSYGFSGDAGPATAAAIDTVYAIAADSQGNLYLADSWNNRIRKVAANGIIATIAGTGEPGFSGDGGVATAAKLNCPRGIAVDGQGNLYISDSGNSRIRKISATGTITTVAGTGTAGFAGDGGPATSAQISYPRGLAVKSDGTLYFADGLNFRIRMISANGTMSTLAGMGAHGASGDGGPAKDAMIGLAQSLTLDSGGNLYFTDAYLNCVRKVTPGGIISTVAGDSGTGGLSQFGFPRGLAVNAQGQIYVADSMNHRVKLVTPGGNVSTIAGTGTAGFSGDGGAAASTQLNYPYALAVNSNGHLVIGDLRNYRIRGIGVDSPVTRFSLWFPFLVSSSTEGTGFAVSNASDTAANLEFKAYGPSGAPLSLPANPSTTVLDANCQLAKMGGDLFGGTGPTSGWVELTADRQVGAFFQYVGGGRLDGGKTFAQTHRKLYFTRALQGSSAFRGKSATTTLNIVNPTAAAVQVTLALRGPAGQVVASAPSQAIPAHGLFSGTVSELFAFTAASDGYVTVDVTQGDGVIGFELITFPQANTVLGLNGQPAGSSSKFYSAQLAQAVVIFTNIKLINTASQTRTLTITAIGDQGQTLAGPVSRTLAGGNSIAEDASTLLSLPASTVLVASLKIEADGPGVIGDVTFGNPDLLNAASLPLEESPFSRAIFSHVANGMGFYTGLALYNPGSQAAQVTVKVYRPNGTSAGTRQLTLGAGARISRLLDEADLVPLSAGQIGGYVVVESTQPLVGQELFGLDDFSVLSAVPPSVF